MCIEYVCICVGREGCTKGVSHLGYHRDRVQNEDFVDFCLIILYNGKSKREANKMMNTEIKELL